MSKLEQGQNTLKIEIAPNAVKERIGYFWYKAKKFLDDPSLDALGLYDKRDRFVAQLVFAIEELKKNKFLAGKAIAPPYYRFFQNEFDLASEAENVLKGEKDNYFESKYGDPELPLTIEWSIHMLYAQLTNLQDRSILNISIEKYKWVRRFKPNLESIPATARIPNNIKWA